MGRTAMNLGLYADEFVSGPWWFWNRRRQPRQWSTACVPPLLHTYMAPVGESARTRSLGRVQYEQCASNKAFLHRALG